MTVDEYAAAAADFLAEAPHPSLGRRLRECSYAPMVELLRLPRDATGSRASSPRAAAATSCGRSPSELYAHPAASACSAARTGSRYTEEEHGAAIDNDQELAASGVAASIGGFPGHARRPGLLADRDHERAGARTQLSELVTVATRGGVRSSWAECGATCRRRRLGCMVVIAVLGLIDDGEYVRFWRLSRLEFWVAVRHRRERPCVRTAGRGARRRAAHAAARRSRSRTAWVSPSCSRPSAAGTS